MSQENITDLNDTDRYCQSMQQSIEIALIKSCREIEARYIDYLSFLSHKEFVPVGPLVQEPLCDYKELFNLIEWLDKKEKWSVVFVSFGTEYFMSMEEIQELAYGLEYSKINFIWVLRFHEEEKIGVKDVLPKCFLESVGMRGMVVEGWAPQGKILEHHSIGGFVSHCGWSSVMEGMTYGIPIIAMPMQLDQPLNSRLVVELGVGMEVERDEDGKYERGEVAKKINKVVIGKEGEKVRSMVKELSEKLGMKGEEERDMVVEKLFKICGRKGEAKNLTR